MVNTGDHFAQHTNHASPYSGANGFERYAFDDLQQIGTGFAATPHASKSASSASSNSLHICFIDISGHRGTRIAGYLRSFGHEVTEFQTADDAFDALVAHEYDLMLVGCVGAARAPLVRAVKDYAASRDTTIRVAVISNNETISNELVAAGADDIVDGNTEGLAFNTKLVDPFRYGKQATRDTSRPATRTPPTQLNAPQELAIAQRTTTKRSNRFTPKTTIAKPADAEKFAPPPRSARTHSEGINEIDFESLRQQVQEDMAHPEPLYFPSPTRETPPRFSDTEHAKPSHDNAATAQDRPSFQGSLKAPRPFLSGAKTNEKSNRVASGKGPQKESSPTGLARNWASFPRVLLVASALAIAVLSNLHHL
jgi:hypothetical protein